MISVVIPAYNEERALPQTLDRLFSQPGEYEVILVDGGSADATKRIARRYPRVQLVNAPRQSAVFRRRSIVSADIPRAVTPCSGRSGPPTRPCAVVARA